MPDVEELRSVSKFGISVVTIVFQEDTEIYRARQLVAERLSAAASLILMAIVLGGMWFATRNNEDIL